MKRTGRNFWKCFSSVFKINAFKKNQNNVYQVVHKRTLRTLRADWVSFWRGSFFTAFTKPLTTRLTFHMNDFVKAKSHARKKTLVASLLQIQGNLSSPQRPPLAMILKIEIIKGTARAPLAFRALHFHTRLRRQKHYG